jgi:predicted ATPase
MYKFSKSFQFPITLGKFATYFNEVGKEIIVIIGGPGTGKSTIIDGLTEKGFCCYPEISRQVTLEAKKQGIEQLFLENPLLFSELLLEGRKKQYTNALNEQHKVVFIDRGIPDILAYMHYIGDSYPTHFDLACRETVYTKIFILPPWEEIYVSDEARYENFEQAKLIHDHLVETYKNYGYELIEVPKDSLAKRILFILDQI